MQVTQVQDTITHAVISGTKAIDFGISDSPEFFHILSSTLYSDQILAVVRETLCNAWDAHIEAGCTDKPIEITLTDTKLTIRDFGPGIHPDMIGPIYGVYGGSTKKNNGKVTGGFGLGCKSPFAYGDHFNVDSFHDGQKTIYKLSKSSAEVSGKPSITPIVSIPTTETGLAVSLDIKDWDDHRRFGILIRLIVSNGEMNAKLNDMILPTIPFSKMENNFLFTRNDIVAQKTSHNVYLRYGHVIYPITLSDEYRDQYSKCTDIIKLIGGYNSAWKLVLQAEPDTITVTPSRESLSMQAFTIKTITQLLDNFLNVVAKDLSKTSAELVQKYTDISYSEMNIKDLFDPAFKVPNSISENRYKRALSDPAYDNLITNCSEFAQTYVLTEYPKFPKFYANDINYRLKILEENNTVPRGMLQSYRKEFNDTVNRSAMMPSHWFHKRVIKPLVMKLTTDPTVDVKKLFVYTRNKSTHWGSDLAFMAPNKVPPKTIESLLPFLRNIVILSHNQTDVKERAPRFTAMKEWFGSVENTLVYVVPRAPAKVEAAREFFTKNGYNIVDLTTVQKWETPDVVLPKKIEKRVKKKGIPILKCILNADTKVINVNGWMNEDVERIEDPEFIFKFSRTNSSNSFDHIDSPTTKNIIELYGSKGGFVVNENQAAKYRAAGSLDMYQYILKDILNEYENNPRIIEWLAFNWKRLPNIDRYGYSVHEAVFSALKYDQDLMDYFGLVDNRNDRDKKICKLFESLRNAYYPTREDDDASAKIQKIINAVKLDDAVNNLFIEISASKLISIASMSDITRALKNKDGSLNEKQRNLVRDIFLQIIEE